MSKTRTVAAVGVLGAVYCVAALISLPLPGMPVTLQCFAVALGAYVFGAKASLWATAVYVALGSAGVPVFAGVRGGVQVLFGATGGFVWGFFFLALACGVAKGRGKVTAVLLGLLGLALCYVLGILQYSVVTGTKLLPSFMGVGAPFLLKDIALVALACFLSAPVIKALNNTQKGKG